MYLRGLILRGERGREGRCEEGETEGEILSISKNSLE